MTPEQVRKRRSLLKFLAGTRIRWADCFKNGDIYFQVEKGDRQYLVELRGNITVVGVPSGTMTEVEKELWKQEVKP